jgi:hypothetical protein
MLALSKQQLATLKRLLRSSYEHALEGQAMHYAVADDAAATRCKAIADHILFEIEYLDYQLEPSCTVPPPFSQGIQVDANHPSTDRKISMG